MGSVVSKMEMIDDSIEEAAEIIVVVVGTGVGGTGYYMDIIIGYPKLSDQ